MTTIFVRNNGSEPFSDGLDGIMYNFEPGKEVEIPEIAAKHIFGYGDDNKEPYLVRLGWMKMSNQFNMAMERLGTFSFSKESSLPKQEPAKTVHLSAPVVERVAAPMPKAKGAAKVANLNG
jgi:hypothetical protein